MEAVQIPEAYDDYVISVLMEDFPNGVPIGELAERVTRGGCDTCDDVRTAVGNLQRLGYVQNEDGVIIVTASGQEHASRDILGG